MSRQVLTQDVTIAATDYQHPARVMKKGTVVELSASEITAVTGAGGAVRATTFRDQLGEGAGAANSN